MTFKKAMTLLCIVSCCFLLAAQKPVLFSPYEVSPEGNIEKPEAKPEKIESYYPLGEKLLIEGKYREALPKFLGAIENNEPAGPAYFNLACTFALSGNYKKAIAFFQKAEGMLPADRKPFANFNIASCLVMIFISKPDENIKSLKKAESFYKKAAFDLSYFSTAGQLSKLIFTWIELSNSNSLSKFTLPFDNTTIFPDSYTLLKADRIKPIGSKIDITLDLSAKPLLFYYNSPVMKFFLANSLVGKRQYDAADPLLMESLNSSAPYFDQPFYLNLKGLLFLTLAESQYNNGKLDLALENNQKAAKILDDDARIYQQALKIHLKSRAYPQAVETAKKLMAREPSNNQAVKISKLNLSISTTREGICSLPRDRIQFRYPANWIPFNREENSDFFSDLLGRTYHATLKAGFSRGIDPDEPYIYIDVTTNELYTPEEKAENQYTQDELYNDYRILLNNEFEAVIKMDPSFQVIVEPNIRKIGSTSFVEYVTMTAKTQMSFYYFIPFKETIITVGAKMSREHAESLKHTLETALESFTLK